MRGLLVIVASLPAVARASGCERAAACTSDCATLPLVTNGATADFAEWVTPSMAGHVAPNECYECSDTATEGELAGCDHSYDGWSVNYCCNKHACTGTCSESPAAPPSPPVPPYPPGMAGSGICPGFRCCSVTDCPFNGRCTGAPMFGCDCVDGPLDTYYGVCELPRPDGAEAGGARWITGGLTYDYSVCAAQDGKCNMCGLGALPHNHSCTYDLDCGDSALCTSWSGATAACSGTCTELRPDGAQAGGARWVTGGLTYDYSICLARTGTCNVCGAGRQPDGFACSYDSDCEETHHCYAEGFTGATALCSGKCVAKTADGGRAGNATWLSGGLSYDYSGCLAGTGICQICGSNFSEVDGLVPLGERCSQNFQCLQTYNATEVGSGINAISGARDPHCYSSALGMTPFCTGYCTTDKTIWDKLSEMAGDMSEMGTGVAWIIGISSTLFGVFVILTCLNPIISLCMCCAQYASCFKGCCGCFKGCCEGDKVVVTTTFRRTKENQKQLLSLHRKVDLLLKANGLEVPEETKPLVDAKGDAPKFKAAKKGTASV